MRIILKLIILSFLSSTIYATESKTDFQSLQKESQAFMIQVNTLFSASKKEEIVKIVNAKLVELDSMIHHTKSKDEVKHNWAKHEYLNIISSSMMLKQNYSFNKDFAISVLNSISPTSDIWTYGMISGSIPFAISKILNLDKKQYIDSMLLYHPKKELRAKLINDLLMFNRRNNPDEYEHYYKMLLSMQDIPECKKLKTSLEKKNPNIGKKLKATGYTNSKKKECTIEFEKYDFYIVDCWTTWCGSCINEMEEIQKIYLAQDTSKIKFIGICIDDKIEKGNKIVDKKFHKNWTSLYLVDKNQESFIKEYNIHIYPHKMILDSEGKILQDKVYIFELEAILNKLTGRNN